MADFPSSITSFSTKSYGQVIDVAHINNLQDEVVAIQTELGTSPSGGFTTVKEALQNVPSPNLLINADFRIDQRNAGSNTTFGTGELCDLFVYHGLSTAPNVTYTLSDTEVPTATSRSIKLQVTTGAAVDTDADNRVAVLTGITGYDYERLHGGKDVTLSFWVKNSVSGQYYVAFLNTDQTRHYVAPYTISSADTWEFKTINITTDNTTTSWIPFDGTFDRTHSARFAFYVYWTLHVGSTYHAATTSAWAAGNKRGTSSGEVWGNTTTNNFYLFEPKLEAGLAATKFIPDDISKTIDRCERFLQTSYPLWTKIGASPATSSAHYTWIKSTAIATYENIEFKRMLGTSITTSNVQFYNPNTGSTGVWYTTHSGGTTTTMSLTNISNKNLFIRVTGSITTGATLLGHWEIFTGISDNF